MNLLASYADDDDDSSPSTQQQSTGGVTFAARAGSLIGSHDDEDDIQPLAQRGGSLVAYIPDSDDDDEEYGKQQNISRNLGVTPALQYSQGYTVIKEMYANINDPGDVLPMRLLPPVPNTHTNNEVARLMHEHSISGGKPFNDSLQELKEFHNPYILRQLASQFAIDQNCTNFSKDIFDPHGVPQEDKYLQLRAERQKENERVARKRAVSAAVDAAKKAAAAVAGNVKSTTKVKMVPNGVDRALLVTQQIQKDLEKKKALEVARQIKKAKFK